MQFSFTKLVPEGSVDRDEKVKFVFTVATFTQNISHYLELL